MGWSHVPLSKLLDLTSCGIRSERDARVKALPPVEGEGGSRVFVDSNECFSSLRSPEEDSNHRAAMHERVLHSAP